MTVEKGRIGMRFDAFLEEEGLLEECTHRAIRQVIAYLLLAEMKKRKLTKAVFARRLKMSHSQPNRLLDPTNMGVTLDMLSRAARAVGER